MKDDQVHRGWAEPSVGLSGSDPVETAPGKTESCPHGGWMATHVLVVAIVTEAFAPFSCSWE